MKVEDVRRHMRVAIEAEVLSSDGDSGEYLNVRLKLTSRSEPIVMVATSAVIPWPVSEQPR
jgi:hypothetical protein